MYVKYPPSPVVPKSAVLFLGGGGNKNIHGGRKEGCFVVLGHPAAMETPRVRPKDNRQKVSTVPLGCIVETERDIC